MKQYLDIILLILFPFIKYFLIVYEWEILLLFNYIIPFYLLFKYHTIQYVIKMGLYYGVVFYGLSLYWVLDIIADKFDISYFLSFILSIVLFILLSIQYVLQYLLIYVVLIKTKFKYAVLLLPIILSICEMCWFYLILDFKYFTYFEYLSIINIDYLSEWASIINRFLLSYIVYELSILLFLFICIKKIKLQLSYITSYILAVIILIFPLFYQNAKDDIDPLRVSYVKVDFKPEDKWNEKNGNQLMKRLVNAYDEALIDHPDYVLWPEGIIPWSYSRDDDFIELITNKTKNLISKPIELIGMYSFFDNNIKYNCINVIQNGDLLHQYKKKQLFPLIETNTFGIKDNIEYFTSGDKYNDYHFKNMGFIICNEIFLLENNFSNNSHIFLAASNSYFSDNHFAKKIYLKYIKLKSYELNKIIYYNINSGDSGYF